MRKQSILFAMLALVCAAGGMTATLATVTQTSDGAAVAIAGPEANPPASRSAFGAVNVSPDELDLVALIVTARQRLQCARTHAAASVCDETRRRD